MRLLRLDPSRILGASCAVRGRLQSLCLFLVLLICRPLRFRGHVPTALGLALGALAAVARALGTRAEARALGIRAGEYSPALALVALALLVRALALPARALGTWFVIFGLAIRGPNGRIPHGGPGLVLGLGHCRARDVVGGHGGPEP